MMNKSIHKKVSTIDWQKVNEELNEKGYSLISQFLSTYACEGLVDKYDESNLYRKTITMERYRFGIGEYKYFKYPLPDLIQTIRITVYPKLVPIANTWMSVLNLKRYFSEEFEELTRLCHQNNQTKPTVLILKYGKGGYNTLHQDLYGEIFFPFQLVIFLSELGEDYIGG